MVPGKIVSFFKRSRHEGRIPDNRSQGKPRTERGGFCDCEVLLNVEPPYDGAAIQASNRAYERIIEAVDEYETAKKRMG